MKRYFELRGTLTSNEKLIFGVIGTILLITIWHAITIFTNVSPGVFPSPFKVVAAIPELHFDDALVRNAVYSLKLNLMGMMVATCVAIPLGFIMGLFPIFRGLSEKQISVLRYLPLTLLIGVFITAFGFKDAMKVSFLAVGIFVYLLPSVVLRVDEVPEVYNQTVKTLGASTWQAIKIVFVPNVLSKVFDDIRVLAPISWTYIIIAEMLNNTGGLGALAYLAGRQSRADKAFAILLVIIFIGVILDKVFFYLDKTLFPYKYATKGGN